MGEFSDYFEDFPEENPANYDANGQFNPNHRADAEKLRILSEKLDEAWARRPLVPTKNPAERSSSLTKRPVRLHFMHSIFLYGAT